MQAAAKSGAKMKRNFPSALKYIGIPLVSVTWILAARLVWEQTVWSWARGPQMVGFSLAHSGLGLLLVLGVLAGLVWVVAVLIAAGISRSLGGKVIVSQLLAYVLACCVIAQVRKEMEEIDKRLPRE